MKAEAINYDAGPTAERQRIWQIPSHLGRRALATAGVTLALLAAGHTKTAADPAPYPDLQVGVATGSWNDDGTGHHTICQDAAEEGMTEVRFNFTEGGPKHPWREMQAEARSCVARGENPIISMPSSMVSPGEAAKAIVHLRQVKEVVYGLEPNAPYFTGTGKPIPPFKYVKDLAHAYWAIHKVRPDVTVDGFALASGYDPVKYFEICKRIADAHFGGLDNIRDENDFHLYHTLTTDLETIKEFEQIDPTGLFRIGETGFIINDPSHPGSVTPAEQAIDETTLVNDVAQDPQITALDLFRYRANSLDPFDTANVSVKGVKRPAFYMLQSTLRAR